MQGYYRDAGADARPRFATAGSSPATSAGGRGRLLLVRGAQEGHHPQARREHLRRRARSRDQRPSRGDGGGGDPGARRARRGRHPGRRRAQARRARRRRTISPTGAASAWPRSRCRAMSCSSTRCRTPRRIASPSSRCARTRACAHARPTSKVEGRVRTFPAAALISIRAGSRTLFVSCNLVPPRRPGSVTSSKR